MFKITVAKNTPVYKVDKDASIADITIDVNAVNSANMALPASNFCKDDED